MIARSSRPRAAGFTLVEVITAMAVLGVFMVAILGTWRTLTTVALNTTFYAQRQNDQMRVLDYLKRDIRRSTKIEIFNGSVPVLDTTTYGSELRLTIPDYYADAREEDNAIGPKVPNAPALGGAGEVSYGPPLVVRYFVQNGAVVRDEAGTLRSVANAAGAFTASFKREADGAVRCRVFFDQPLAAGSNRLLRRQAETICVPRFSLQI